MIEILGIILSGYVIGSISFARLVTRYFAHLDVTQFEIPVNGTQDRYKVISIGGNSVSSVLGPKIGMLVSLLDMLKIILPTLACRLLFDQPYFMLIIAASGIAGHIWPIFYKFHGGSGFSSIIGSLLVIDPMAAVLSPVVGLILGLMVFRNIIAASMLWLWLLIPWFWWRYDDYAFLIFALGVNIMVILAMAPEIKLARKYSREGKRLEYGLSSLKSHPMGRGMLKMAQFFKVEIK